MVELSENSQTRLLYRIVKEIRKLPFVQRMILICSYAAVVGKINEATLLSLMNFAGISENEEIPAFLLRFYQDTGMIEVEDQGLGLEGRLPKGETEVTPDLEEFLTIARSEILDIRRTFQNDG